MALSSALHARLRIPVVAAPMFLASGPDLVVECCRAGIVGTFPALNLRTTEHFDQWLADINTALADESAWRTDEVTPQSPAPFGVNLIVHKTNRRLTEDLEVIVKHQVPIVFTSLGAAQEVVEAIHSYGGLVFHDVTNAKFAGKAAAAGVDGLVLVASGAGGHAGSTNPFALVSEVRRVWDGPLALAGGLTSGADVLAAQALGADLAYLGTRFLATDEAMVSDDYKQMLVQAEPSDIIYTPSISTIPASFLRQSIAAAGLDPDRLAAPERVDLEHLTNPHDSGSTPQDVPKAWRDIWSAGQGVAGIDEVLPAAQVVDRLAHEYFEAISALDETAYSGARR